MALRLVKILTANEHKKLIKDQAEDIGVIEFWIESAEKEEQSSFNILVSADKVQSLTDELQGKMNGENDWRIIVTSVETVIPRPEEEKPDEDNDNPNAKKMFSGTITREALYDKILKGTEINVDFISLVLLSALVAAIGIITDNIAVVIGAMVIAPLLGPNLALSFGITLGDKGMITQSVKANIVGLGLTLVIAALIGLVVPHDTYAESEEFLSRTHVGYSAVVLAFAAGFAGVLSLTSGISSAMVGVMVAVAMMPPAVVLGVSIGAGQPSEIFGAALLLAVNIICVNIAAKLVFAFKGIRPRTWYKQEKSKQSLRLSLSIWAALLFVACVLIFISNKYFGI